MKGKGYWAAFGLTVLLYPTLAFLWEVSLAKMVCYWWLELFSMRSALTQTEAMLYFAEVAFMTFVVSPTFFWAPVWLYPEVVYIFQAVWPSGRTYAVE